MSLTFQNMLGYDVLIQTLEDPDYIEAKIEAIDTYGLWITTEKPNRTTVVLSGTKIAGKDQIFYLPFSRIKLAMRIADPDRGPRLSVL